MLNREIEIPGFLHEFHGRKARVSSVLAVYLSGIMAAGIFIAGLLPHLGTWRLVAVSLIMFDICGGVAANLSTSTNRYYQERPRRRVPFLIIHVLHISLLAFVFPQHGLYFGFVGGYTITMSLLVNAVDGVELQQNLAAGLVIAGLLVSVLFRLDYSVLYCIAPMFMLKLILGFSVRRPVLE